MALAVILMIVLLGGTLVLSLHVSGVDPEPRSPQLPTRCTCPYATYNQQFKRWQTHVRPTCPLHGWEED